MGALSSDESYFPRRQRGTFVIPRDIVLRNLNVKCIKNVARNSLAHQSAFVQRHMATKRPADSRQRLLHPNGYCWRRSKYTMHFVRSPSKRGLRIP